MSRKRIDSAGHCSLMNSQIILLLLPLVVQILLLLLARPFVIFIFFRKIHGFNPFKAVSRREYPAVMRQLGTALGNVALNRTRNTNFIINLALN